MRVCDICKKELKKGAEGDTYTIKLIAQKKGAFKRGIDKTGSHVVVGEYCFDCADAVSERWALQIREQRIIWT